MIAYTSRTGTLSTLPLLDSAHRQVGLLHHERRHQPRPEDG